MKLLSSTPKPLTKGDMFFQRVQDGFVEEYPKEEEAEYDEDGNPRVDPNRFGLDRCVQPPPEGTGSGNTGNINTGAGKKINGNNGAPNANILRMQRRPTLILSQATWDK
jgi:hypothetical protein